MAQIKHLPIYKTAYELLETTVKVTKEFPRDFKFSLGDKKDIRAVANSYFGIFRQAKTWAERKKIAILLIQFGWWFTPKLDKVILRKAAA